MLSKLLFFTVFFASIANATVVHREVTQDYAIELKEIAKDLYIPWGMEFLDGNTLLVNQKDGKMLLVDLKSGKQTKVQKKIGVSESGQGGSLDILKHPKYPEVPWIYWTFVEKFKGKRITVLSRFQLEKNKMVKFERLLRTKSGTTTSRHFGSRIAFDEKGFLFFTTGDRGRRPNGQNLKTHAGTVMRLNDDGSIPKDNPFFGRKDALPEIWSYGHRNPQGMGYDPIEKKLWAIEHGPRGGDEINLIEKGKNYGWATISYGKEYISNQPVGESTKKEGLEQPVHYYVPSIAPGGMAVYRGKMFPKWGGNLFSGALKLAHLNRVKMRNGKFVKEERLLKNFSQRIRHVKEAPDGSIYLSTDTGQILKLQHATPTKKSI